MNAPILAEGLEFRLLNEFQRDFPLCRRPFAAIAARLGSDEETVLACLRALAAQGMISRVGAVFAPRTIGASTLAAMAVPRERLEEVAAIVSAKPGVNHNYEREHRFNLWFVAAAPDETALSALLDTLEKETGHAPIAMPLVEEFHIDLGFDLLHGGKRRDRPKRCERRPMSATQRRLIAALQPGLPLVPEPFAQLAEETGMTEEALLWQLKQWLEEGSVKRFGVVVRHHELGFCANAMVVFDVPDETASEIGSRLAAERGVTLCYRRARCLPHWPYNLFCMVHGRTRAEVAPVIERLQRLAGHPAEVLFSVRRFKQCGARYFDAS
ncbi:MAG: Lrp/AsnC family transcriptional regulator [Rhodocyclaceae bacterium]|nr:Lrp/AsnC family transcriptional regulator [Rhodocyclaceae bacterium]